MGKFGRKVAMITSIVPIILGWVFFAVAESITILIFARVLQGLAMGLGGSLGPILIGEYTSPKNRGAFLTTISLSISISVFTVHALGSYFSWQTTALVCAFISIVDLVIVVFSPESPVWLANQGRYRESKIVFRWLRGYNEDDELIKMIEDRKHDAQFKEDCNDSLWRKVKRNTVYFKATIKKKEFYKPIFIMLHVYALGQWSGATILVGYTVDVFENVVGHVDFALMLMILDIQRIISNLLAISIIRKLKRRTLLFISGGITLTGFALTALYTFLKSRNLLPIDHPSIGILLIHILMFSVATGSLPLSFIFAGELFPLEYRSLAGGLSIVFYSVCLFLTLKTFSFLITSLAIYGAFCVYFLIVLYCLTVLWFTLPETKDRTLQDIEEEFKGTPSHCNGTNLESILSDKGEIKGHYRLIN